MSLEIPEEVIARQPAEAQGLIRLLLAHIVEQDRRIVELESRLKLSPRNSSLPPSSEHPHAKPSPPPKTRSKKKRGGQPGHVKHERPLIPVEDCTAVIPLKPSACRRCGSKLRGDDAVPLRHQVWELPEIRPLVTEYQRHRLECPCCRERTCAELPLGVPTGQSGPRLVAFTALLMAYYRQSKSRTAQFLSTLLGQPCCPALTVKLQNLATEATRPVYDELVARLPTQPHLNIDESPTKEASRKSWLWTFVARDFTVFTVRATRAATALSDLLTDRFRGAITCDRAKMYWASGVLQWCWAHLKRDFQALIDHTDGQVRRLGHDLRRHTQELFRQWHRFRAGELTRPGLKRLLAPTRENIEALLQRGVFSGNERLTGMCRELWNHRDWLWTFLDHDGVEPTNNAAERSLRHAVIWRKLSFGTQSAPGSRFVETLLTVIETCRQQARNTFQFLTTAVQALFAKQKAPSLATGP
jgi:transposase